MLRTTATGLLNLALILGVSPAWGNDSPRFLKFLGQQAGADNGDLERYSKDGNVFVKILRPVRQGEVAVAGAVRIPVTIDFFLDRFRDIETFAQAPEVVSIGKFSTPPEEQNLQKLRLGDDALGGLAECRPGKCSLKLSAEMMSRLRNAAASIGRGPKLESEFNTVLFNYLSSYIQKGTPAMITYSDTDPPVESSRDFLAMLEQFAWLEQDAPPLYEALKTTVRSAHPEVNDFFYWSKEAFGLKPVVSVTQVLILKTTISGQPWAFIASKQIYADHYYQASLGLTVLASESADPKQPQISVAYFNRSQTDGLRGWFASIERALIERRVRAGMTKKLTEMRERLGKAYP